MIVDSDMRNIFECISKCLEELRISHMPKTLLQQAIEKQDVPAGTIQDKFNKGWLRLKRPKNTTCPFGERHASNCNVRIREFGAGYQLRCFGTSCKGKSIERDTNCGYTEEEWKKVQVPVYTADMF